MWALGLLTIGASGQRLPQPPANEFYRTDVVPRIDITIPADSLAAIFANVTSDYEYHASFATPPQAIRCLGLRWGSGFVVTRRGTAVKNPLRFRSTASCQAREFRESKT